MPAGAKRVVDFGAREGRLGELAEPVEYIGVDRDARDGIVQCDLDEPGAITRTIQRVQPDAVLALDVLEHLDDPHRALHELLSADVAVVTLPNCLRLTHRLRLVRGRMPSGKYGLPRTRPDDRHRWFFGLDDAVDLLGSAASRRPYRCDYLMGRRYQALPAAAARRLAPLAAVGVGTLYKSSQ